VRVLRINFMDARAKRGLETELMGHPLIIFTQGKGRKAQCIQKQAKLLSVFGCILCCLHSAFWWISFCEFYAAVPYG